MGAAVDERRSGVDHGRPSKKWVGHFEHDRRYAFVALAGFVVLGAVLRVVGADWGLPGGLHPDEWAIVDPAVDMAARNSFEPNLYLRPNHLEAQASFIAFQAYAHLVAGTPVEVLFAQTRDPFLVLARLTIALFGIVMIPLAYLILSPVSRVAGLFAAAFIAVNPFYVEHSHYATPDVSLTALTMLGIFALSRYLLSDGDTRLLVLASVAAGLAITSKYPGAIFTSIIAVSVLALAVRKRSWRLFASHGLLAFGVFVVSIFLASPSLFTNVNAVSSAIVQESRSTHAGADGLGAVGNATFYATVLAQDVGILLIVLAIVGAIFAVHTRLLFLLPLVSGLVFWACLSVLSLHWDRWGAPMFVTPVLLAALGVYAAIDFARTRLTGNRRSSVATVSLVAVICISLLAAVVHSVGQVARFLAPDTRLTQAELLAENDATRANTVFEGYTPFFPNGARTIFDRFEVVDGRLEALDDGAEFVVLSSGMFSRFTRDDRYPDQRAFYDRLRSEYELIARVAPTAGSAEMSILEPIIMWENIHFTARVAQGGTVGPTLEIYRIPN